jgi:hypothetical protein
LPVIMTVPLKPVDELLIARLPLTHTHHGD